MPRTENVRRTEEVLTGIIVAIEIKVEIAHTVALVTTPLIAVIVIATMIVLRLLGGKSISKQRTNPRYCIFFYEIMT